MKHLLTLLLATASLALVGCGASEPGPGDTVKDFTYAMEEGDVETVKKTMPVLGTMMGNDKLEKNIKEGAAKIEEEGGIKSITIDKEEISEDGKSAKVTATLEKGNGDKETEDFQLNKTEEGNWIIVMPDEEKGPLGPGGGGAPDLNGGIPTPDGPAPSGGSGS